MRACWFMFAFLFVAASSGLILGQDTGFDATPEDEVPPPSHEDPPGQDPPSTIEDPPSPPEEEEVEDPPPIDPWPVMDQDEEVQHDNKASADGHCMLCAWFSVNNTPTVINPAKHIESWLEAHIHSTAEDLGLPGKVYLWVSLPGGYIKTASFDMEPGGPIKNAAGWMNIQNTAVKRYNFRVKNSGTYFTSGLPYSFEDLNTNEFVEIKVFVNCVRQHVHTKTWRVTRA